MGSAIGGQAARDLDSLHIQQLGTGERNSVQIQLLHPRATLPSRAHQTDAGLDISSVRAVFIPPGTTELVPVGFAVTPPPGMYMQLISRSSLAKRGITVEGGVIDPGYTGEVSVILRNSSAEPYAVAVGERVAQMIAHMLPIVAVQAVDKLGQHDRGEKGFGSSG
ncbi:dUTPase-like protein, partial [Linderina pennispora]